MFDFLPVSKRGYFPANIEELRTKYKVMANMFLLANMRQPSRNLYRDMELNTFSNFLDGLLTDRNFLVESDDNDGLVTMEPVP